MQAPLQHLCGWAAHWYFNASSDENVQVGPEPLH